MDGLLMDDTEYEKIERITDQWEEVGLMPNHPDQKNVALCLRTQAKVVATKALDPHFARISIPAVARTLVEKPDALSGGFDPDGLTEVFFLCHWNPPVEGEHEDADISRTMGIVQAIKANVPEGTVFGGLVEKKGKVYLIGGK